MKQIVSVRSNPFYAQKESDKELTLISVLELVIIYIDGKDYKFKGDLIAVTDKLSEIRMLVSEGAMDSLIKELQTHQKRIAGFKQNAEQINSLIKYIQTDADKCKFEVMD